MAFFAEDEMNAKTALSGLILLLLIGKPFHRVSFRVAEIGEPKLKIRDRVVAFKQAVGFGGAVILTASPAKLHDIFP